MRRGYAGEPGAQTHFRRSEQPGRPIVLLHPSPTSSAMWEALVPELEERGWAPVAFDLPGYGMSDPAGASIADFAARIAAAHDELTLGSCPVVGQHTGASVALQLAHDRPDLVSAVVGLGVPYLDDAAAAALANEAAPVFDREGDALLARWQLFWDRVRTGAHVALTTRTVGEWLALGERSPAAHNAVGRADHRALLNSLVVPMLALAGAHDVLSAQTRRAAEEFEHVEHHDLGDAGSFVADERPRELADVIDRFLSR